MRINKLELVDLLTSSQEIETEVTNKWIEIGRK